MRFILEFLGQTCPDEFFSGRFCPDKLRTFRFGVWLRKKLKKKKLKKKKLKKKKLKKKMREKACSYIFTDTKHCLRRCFAHLQ